MSVMEEMMTRDFLRAVSAEFMAMFFLIFVGIGCALTTNGIPEGANGQGVVAMLTISFCFSILIFVLIHCFGHISGAHINPAVTLALLIAKQISVVKAVCYMAAHFVSSIIATAILMVVMGLKPETMGGYNALTGPDDNKVARGLIVEMILTFLLCFTVFATIDKSRETTGLGPLAIGFAVGVSHCIALPITGCSLNPARSLGPAIFADQDAAREDLWVFILAPFLGAALCAVVYPFWFAGNIEGGLKEKMSSKSEVKAFEGE